MKKIKKYMAVVLALSVVLALGCVFACAAEGDPDFSATITASFQTMVTNLLSMLAAILPIALSLISATLIVAKGIVWFNNIIGAKKGGKI